MLRIYLHLKQDLWHILKLKSLTENIKRYIEGKPLKEEFDGHANCFIETGHGKALLIDFNYTQEPVKGTFPFPGVGPL